MRYAAVLFALSVVSSCREITPFESLTAISGYQLDGTVTTKDGRPLDSVSVRVNYFYQMTQQTPLDTVRVRVVDSTHPVVIAVYTTDNVRVRTIYSGHLPLGYFPRYTWDERDDKGNYAPSGKYYLRYTEAGAVVKTVPWLADGHLTTLTNIAGQFTLRGAQVPADEAFDLYYYDGSYDGTYLVLPKLYLELRRGPLHGIGDGIPLTKNYIARSSFIIE